MGVPDFLKFVARSAPAALCRLPKAVAGAQAADSQAAGRPTRSPAHAALLEYDYVLVDATNAAQTIGLERLYEFLSDPRLVVHKAIVLALDAGRTREGTARHQRQAHLMVGDLDVKVQQLCSSLTELHRKRAVAAAKGCGEGNPTKDVLRVPYVVMSGRGVAGEADYKVLDLQRTIVASALAGKEATLPRFLFISEDSDILCGALCGPAPQNVSIATNLRDTMFELCVLRLEHVITYVAVCVDALLGGEEQEKKQGSEGLDNDTERPLPAIVEDTTGTAGVSAPSTEVKQAACASAPSKAEEDVVRRRKQDGPMVAAGTRVTLEDSSDSDEDEAEAPRAKQPVSVAPSSKGKAPEPHTKKSEEKPIPSFELAAGKMVHASCVDLVFLFVVVMGNGVNVPPLVRGVTKVDIASCWQAYCKHKFTAHGVPGVGGFITQEEQEMGRALLSPAAVVTTSVGKDDGARAHLALNARFLLSILESVHYADAQSRPPVEEEKNRAMAYLSNAVYATLRYIVACNMNSGPAIEETFLDSRPLAETDVLVPSLAAVLWVLSQEHSLTFTFPLQGLAKKELLRLQGGGTTLSEPALSSSAAKSSAGSSSAHPSDAKRAGAARSSLVLCVGDELVCPPSTSASASSWAMARGGAGGARGAAGHGTSRTFTLSHIMHTPNTISLASGNAAPMRAGVSGIGGGVDSQATAVASLVKSYCHQQHQDAMRKNAFTALEETWRRSVALAVPVLKAVAKKSLFMSPVTGNVVAGPLADVVRSTGKDGANASAAGRAEAAEGMAKSTGTKLVYSFELRRMTPLLTTAGDDEDAENVVFTSTSAASGKGGTVVAAAGAVPAAPLSAAQAALQAALGVSFDYAKPPPASTSVVVDPKELELVNRPKRKKTQRDEDGNSPSLTGKENTAAKVAKTEGESAEKGKYRRPGKKERKRLQQERHEKETTPSS